MCKNLKQISFFVTPQVVDKYVLYLIKMNLRHPERSEGPPESGTILFNLRSLTIFGMTYLGCYKNNRDSKKVVRLDDQVFKFDK